MGILARALKLKILGEIASRLESLEKKVLNVLDRQCSQQRRYEQMNAELQRLTEEVAETRTVVESAVGLIEGLAQQIRDLKYNPEALARLADDLDTQNAELAAAVAANTGGGAGEGGEEGEESGGDSGDTGDIG